ncbi:hypothetical protein CBS115989_6239 [Aspergillus niger]|uniref:Trans-aconitate 2-methyltransferase n=1 Tax=Aspergillus niger ATCC 13496 TaxID=1353008 RepID=A0A370C391_ASPNG|nr:hypothetical protein CBS115989_6239 [Aspergillus niger]KAI2862188.1 hypothetical protein CBS11232_409 [Aspergillus niger]KAI2870311.1 hypothetical protein CBS115988_9420 [Aspergillus niger]RDH21519.1 trans-aconitate 2-methyltransferase [Aspergillus niger ATCC 13496]|eukprot:XP_001397953.2 trans-aconitate 2-methyltransferase [Aspergillus niger CBS 513.88]
MFRPRLPLSPHRFSHLRSHPAKTSDWSATQYLKFADERAIPTQDLLSHIPLQSPSHIVDLGCGPGNSTAMLSARYPSCPSISGIDSSPNMIARAKESSNNNTTFAVADVETYSPPPNQPVDLFFSNAVLHWLPRSTRLPTIRRLLLALPPGGVFAFQVPDTLNEPSHTSMREVARTGPWAEHLRGTLVERDELDSPGEIYDALVDCCESLRIWESVYYHSLGSWGEIVEWVKGTGLRPYLDGLRGEEERGEFLKVYEEKLREKYEKRADGRVLLRYPRLFAVAVRK